MASRRFLYVIAGLIVLALLAGIGWTLFQDRLMRLAFVPTARFTPPADKDAPDYARATAWVARPDLATDPARWTPPGIRAAERPRIAVFYVPPTTYLGRDHWNAPLDDGDANARLRLFTASQASAFNGIGAIWAPRYRQATLGAFLAESPDAEAARDFAYRDVARAFDAFLAAIPPEQPILLAGHSQGALHLLRLLHERVAGTPLARRIVAVYAIGWPVSVTADLPALGLPACASPAQTGCLLAWQSFAEPADPHMLRDLYAASTGFTGTSRRGTPMLCVNPLTGGARPAAPPAANLGALVPHADMAGGDLTPGLVGARCDGRGLLLIGEAPKGFDRLVLPGGNFHVFDYALFWSNIRADAAARMQAYLKAEGAP